ncbi:FAD-dependent oxidoreductase [Nocardia fusca]|uniref:FAD-dependent oxidoreductase n=1 Tax=Nocardia fusca TaxID=941183 RepID=UPI00378ACE67
MKGKDAVNEEVRKYWWMEGLFNPPPRPSGFAVTDRDEFDVIVVGSGMAGMCTAILAHDRGADVIVLEASDEVGGTTYKSGGAMWIPDNSVMRNLGIRDDRDTVLRYIVQVALPEQYDPDAERFGAQEWHWEAIQAFYDHAATAIDALVDAGAFRVTTWPSFTERYPAIVSYHPDLDNSIQGFYRHLGPARPDGTAAPGADLVDQLGAAVKHRGIELRTGYRVQNLIQDDTGAAIGVIAGDETIYARRGVVFASGGFAHNQDLIERYWRGPLYSSCAVATAQGDFVSIAHEAGAELAHMRNGWLYEDILEKAAQNRVNEDKGIPVPPGDSMIYVDRNGNRVVNEKLVYQDRNRVIWERDENGDYPNRVLFMVYDDYVANDPKPTLFWDMFSPPKPYIIEGRTWAELSERIEERLTALAPVIGDFRLAPDFAGQLGKTVERYNAFAETGVDEDFHRCENMSEYDWHGSARPGNDKNPGMFPLAGAGPYYCVLICGMVLDTNGGPKTDAGSRVLRPDGSAIPGLYGAGNCVASIAGDGYLSLGSTLGPAATFAYLAAENVAREEPRDIAAARAGRERER